MKIVWWIVGMLLLVSVTVWEEWPNEIPIITMCDVGQGDGLVVTQGFSQLVVDVGSVGEGMLPCLSKVMPFWDRHIEEVIITHTDADHAGALIEILDRYQIGEVVTNETSMEVITARVGGRTRVVATWAGQTWMWGKIEARVLWPLQGKSDRNDNRDSLVIRLELPGAKSIWLAADTDIYVEEQLIQMGAVIPSTILKVAHHGSGTASCEPFMAILRPSQAWISVGKDNKYGHPSQEVVDRLKVIGAEVRRTDDGGMIQL